MSRLLTPEEAEILRDSETRHALTFAVAMAFVVGGALIFGGVWSAVVLPDWTWLVTFAIFAMGGAVIMLLLLLGFRRGRRHVADVVDLWRDWVNAEIKAKEPAPPTLPATLPQENRTIPVMSGDRVVDVPLNLLHGFDPRDMEFLCRLLAKEFKFTEESMENLELPYSRKAMGKAQAGTLYTKFMDVCGATGIIEGRKPKYSGKLMVKDADEMLRRIKALPEITPDA